MKKILNNPNAYVDEMLESLCLAHPELQRRGDGGRVVVRSRGAVSGKVGIATSGGSGHLPVLPRWCAAMHAAMAELNTLDGRLGDADLGVTLDCL